MTQLVHPIRPDPADVEAAAHISALLKKDRATKIIIDRPSSTPMLFSPIDVAVHWTRQIKDGTLAAFDDGVDFTSSFKVDAANMQANASLRVVPRPGSSGVAEDGTLFLPSVELTVSAELPKWLPSPGFYHK